jgi:hypothetical protein
MEYSDVSFKVFEYVLTSGDGSYGVRYQGLEREFVVKEPE